LATETKEQLLPEAVVEEQDRLVGVEDLASFIKVLKTRKLVEAQGSLKDDMRPN
jgi:hypothetical protein